MSTISRCINIDWLEVFAYEASHLAPMNADFFARQGWPVEVREYGTRSYREMFTLLDQDGNKFIEVRRDPIGMFRDGSTNYGAEPYGCHLRLVNRYCYADNAADLMRQFMARSNYIFGRVAKIDLALDFVKFDSGDDPQMFVQRYLRGRYSKVNQAHIAAYGQDDWSDRRWNSLSWGADRSPILTRIYDKTFELQSNDKPYIRQAWALAGLVDDPVSLVKYSEDGVATKPRIWRLEFSIRSAVKGWVTLDDESKPRVQGKAGHKHFVKISKRNNLDMYDSREKLLQMHFSLAQHYFKFKHYEEGKSKYKCKDKSLFDYTAQSAFYKVQKVASAVKRDVLVDRLIALLCRFNELHYDRQCNKAVEMVIEDLRQYQLRNMAVDRFDRNEIKLLQHLIRRRLSNSEEPFALSKEVAEQFVLMEQQLWHDKDFLLNVDAPND